MTAEAPEVEENALSESEAREAWGKPLPSPLCGCCRQKVKIVRSGVPAPGARGREGRKYYATHVYFPCRCRETRSEFPCLLCTRCPDHCRCPNPTEPR